MASTYTCTNFLPPMMPDSVLTGLPVMQIPEMAQCIQLTWKNIFVIFDAFAANFGGCFANFVVISTFYDPRNAMQRLLCQACAAPERKNLHFSVVINNFFSSIHHFHLCCQNELGGLQTGHRLMMNIDGLNRTNANLAAVELRCQAFFRVQQIG